MAPHRQSPQCPRKMQQEQLEPTAGLQQHQQEVATVTRTVTQKLLTVAAALQCTAAPLQEPPRAPRRQSPRCPRKMQQEQLEPTAGLQQHQQEVATVTRTVTQKLLTVAAALQCTAAPLQEPPRAPRRQSPRCPRKMQKEQQALRVGLQQRHPQVAAKSTVTQLLMLVAVALQEPPPAHRRHNPRCPRCPHLSFRCHQSLLPCPPCRPFCARLPGTPLRSAPVERVTAFLNFLRVT